LTLSPSLEILEGRIALATFLVVNPLDGPGNGPAGSLRDAIVKADISGDATNTIIITPYVGRSILLNSGELVIDTEVNLVNRSGRPIEIRQTTPGERIFRVTDDPLTTRFTISAFSGRQTITLSGGNVDIGNGGGILVENAATMLSLTHVVMTGNSAGLATSPDDSQNGGAIYASGSVFLSHSIIGSQNAPNQSSGSGGGIWSGAGVTLTASTVSGNRAGADGGGLFVNSGDTNLARSSVIYNQALNVGGINAVNGDVRIVDGSRVNWNSSTAYLDIDLGNFGGGGVSTSIGDVYVEHSQVSYNTSVGMFSAGIVVGLGSVTVTSNSRIIGNVNNGPGGGIAANFGGIVTVSGRSQVKGNTGSGIGGGIVNFAGPMGGVHVLQGSEVSQNTLTNYETLGEAILVFLEVLAGSLGMDFEEATGGMTREEAASEIEMIEQDVAYSAGVSPAEVHGLLVSGGGIGTLLGAPIIVDGGSRVDGNYTAIKLPGSNPNSIGIGGGIFSGLGNATIRNSSVSGNTSQGAGGGLWIQEHVTVTGSTIAGNAAVRSEGGGLLNSLSSTASIRKSKFRNNRSARGGGIFNDGSLELVDSDVIGNYASMSGGGIATRGQLALIRTKVRFNTPDNIDTTP
jgi:hypothetical protein